MTPFSAEFVLPTLHGGVQSAVPLLLAANGELISERGGLINIGIEGTMLTGAFVGAAATWYSGSALFGLAAAAAAGAAVGLLFGVWTVLLRRDQIVTGLAINLLALGLTGMAFQRLDAANRLPTVSLAWMPPTALAFIVMTHVFLTRTRPGLTLWAVGENAEAADAAGVRVDVVRVVAATVGSSLVAVGGGYLALAIANGFQEQMTGGRGFLALALVIFGRWSPPGILFAALFFGCLDALQIALQPELGDYVHLLHPALLALPYVLTLVALAGLAGRAHPPAALGVPYERT